MSPVPTARPYAAKAIVEHEFDTDHLNVFVTFRFPMNQNNKPEHDLWSCEVDDDFKAVTVSAWQDAYTLLLTVPDVVVLPDRVTLEYLGPDEDLQTTWEKQWEPWGPIVSIEIPPVRTTRTFSTGPAQQNDVDISNVNILFLNCAANNITIGGFIGGVDGQVLQVAKICAAVQDVTLKHIALTDNQDMYLHAGGDETLRGEYGGWTLVCDGDNWYDVSHAKHT
ncbi:unnamed protein product [marine sediment metagenome]|uniref:Uncharacterized protein n=1 Tax=marine sediment metagenome TaxID=412755 RepID=X1VAC5_9ZZZZ